MREFSQVSAFTKDGASTNGREADRTFEFGEEDAAVAYFGRLRGSGLYEYITLEWCAATGEDVKA